MQLGNHVGLNIVKISGILVYIEIHLIDAPSKGVVVQQQQQTCVSIQSRLALLISLAHALQVLLSTPTFFVWLLTRLD
jgi:hypothetical protein